MDSYKKRRIFVISFILFCLSLVIIINTPVTENPKNDTNNQNVLGVTSDAIDALNKIPIKGRAPKTDYSRDKFGTDWIVVNGCDTRNIILNRDLTDVAVNDKCQVISGKLNDPYSGQVINFKRGTSTSSDIQIDHVVSLSDAWQKGAQLITKDIRIKMANDPLELLAVDGQTNMQKSDGDAATWLPPNKSFRCQYIARQIAVKIKYNLWVSKSEYDVMKNILNNCPNQLLPNP